MWCVGVHVGACDVVQVRGSLSEGLALETLPREGISMRMPPGPKHFASSSGQTGHPYRGHMRFENGPDFKDYEIYTYDLRDYEEARSGLASPQQQADSADERGGEEHNRADAPVEFSHLGLGPCGE